MNVETNIQKIVAMWRSLRDFKRFYRENATVNVMLINNIRNIRNTYR